jgi:methionyl-tRNA formyltransferase
MSRPRYRVVCLIARPCGALLLDTLLRHPAIDVVGVFTHSTKPTSEDPARGERPEFALIRELLANTSVPLHVVNTSAEARELTGFDALQPFDFLVSLSWRFLVPPRFLGRSRLADINLHRGQLPKYGGAEPVRRMLEDGLSYATITAHLMTEALDAGEVLVEDHLAVAARPDEPLAQLVERVKQELDPMYPVTALAAIDKVLVRRGLPPLGEVKQS